MPSLHRTATATELLALTALLAAALTLGCNSKTAATPENFTLGLNTYLLSHPDCLLPDPPKFPFATTDSTRTRQMDALVAAQLLTRGTEPAIHVSRYTLTDAGRRYAPRFCYGHRQVTGIVRFTPPAKANGFIESEVTYTYTLTDVPVWARGAAMQASFPPMAEAVTKGGTASRVLAQTMTGWQVPE
jgi:hypothetical protein